MKEGHEFHPRHEQSQPHTNVGSNSVARTIRPTHTNGVNDGSNYVARTSSITQKSN